MEHFYIIIALLSVIGFGAGLIDTLAGGGGLITVPALLAVGLPPALALGTNRLQACMGELNASLYFLRKKKITIKTLMQGLIFTGIGSTLGTILIQAIHEDIARKIIPWLLLGIILYTFFSPHVSREDVSRKMPETVFFPLFGFLIGFYNGFFGPGTGAFWVFALMFFLGLNIVNATVNAKPMNFIGNFVSLLWFMVGGNVSYGIAIAMGVGQLLGSYVGAHIVITKGAKLIKRLYIIMVMIMMVSLMMKKGSI